MKKLVSMLLALCMMLAMGVVAFAEDAVEVATYEELVAAFAGDEPANVKMTADITGEAGNGGYSKAGIVLNAGDVLDGNGYTLTITGANGTWDCAIAMKGGEVKNLTVAGAFRGIFMPGANGDVVIDTVVFKDVIYTFNSDAGSKDYSITIKNSTINGWTSFSDVHKSVTFENCDFGEGSGYAFCRPYQATTFTDCDFDEGFEFDNQKTDASGLKFDDCTYAGEPLSSENNEMFYAGGNVVIDGEVTDVNQYVAQIGENKYLTLAEAVAVGGEVTLLSNVELTETITITKDVTLDLNGYTVTNSTTATITIDGGKLTVKDSSENESGAIVAASNGANDDKAAILFTDKSGKFTLESGTLKSTKYGIRSTKGSSEIVINGGTIDAAEYGVIDFLGSVTMNGGEIKSGVYGIAAYGTFTMNGGKITAMCGYTSNGSRDYTVAVINDGIIEATEYDGIYWPSAGSLTINGGSITGACGVYVKSGSVAITGGTITATGEKDDYAFEQSGSVVTGDALVIENVGGETGYEAITSVSITGGTFISENASAVASYAATTVNEDAVAIDNFISGGIYNTDSTKYLTEDAAYAIVISSENTVYAIGAASIQEVAENASAGDQIIIDGDVDLVNVPAGVTVVASDGSNVTVNGVKVKAGEDGYTVPAPVVKPESKPDSIVIDINGKNDGNEENPNTGAPVMIPVAAVLAVLSGAVVFKRK